MEPRKGSFKLQADNLPDAFVRHRLLFDDHGTPADFVLLEVNCFFEELVGRKREDLVGKKFSETEPPVKEAAYSWLSDFSKLSQAIDAGRFEYFSEPLGRWYELNLFSGEPGCFDIYFRDINHYKVQLSEVKRRNKSLHYLANNIPDVVARFDTSLKHIYVNRTAGQVLGLPGDIFIGHSFLDLLGVGMPEELADQLRAMHTALKECRESGEEQQFTGCFKLPDGEKHLLTRIVPEKEQGGKIASLLAITTDVTGSRQDEKRSRVIAELLLGLGELNDLNKALRLCLDAALAATAFDSGGIYLADVQDGAMKLAVHRGLSASFVEKVSLLGPESPSRCLIMAGQPLYKKYKKMGIPLDPVRQDEGLEAVAIVPVLYGQKIIACFNVASHSTSAITAPDKTTLETIAAQVSGFLARLQAEEALRESEEKFRLITENMIDVVWLRSADNSQMLYISPSYEQVWGRSCRSLYDDPQSFMDTVYAEDMEKVKAEFARYLEHELFDLE